MNIKSLKIVSFSPTGTTTKVVNEIAKVFSSITSVSMDITRPEERLKSLKLGSEDLLIIGVPVYMGRVPLLLDGWFEMLKADNTPCVCVVVYGNREFDDALLELKNKLSEKGCVPVAGCAFIGEHSFSDQEYPTAMGRPDVNDLKIAGDFGRKVMEKLESSLDSSELNIPGNFPYGGLTELWNVDFIQVNDNCVQCGICADLCPMEAVSKDDSNLIHKEKCITCCACIKGCPQNARQMKESPVKEAQKRLYTLYSERKEPVYFL